MLYPNWADFYCQFHHLAKFGSVLIACVKSGKLLKIFGTFQSKSNNCLVPVASVRICMHLMHLAVKNGRN